MLIQIVFSAWSGLIMGTQATSQYWTIKQIHLRLAYMLTMN